jgi:type I restriction-modification system DNA methylase subunit
MNPIEQQFFSDPGENLLWFQPCSPRAYRRAIQNIPGFCYSATLDNIRKHEYVLAPVRYMAAGELESVGGRTAKPAT